MLGERHPKLTLFFQVEISNQIHIFVNAEKTSEYEANNGFTKDRF